MDLNNFSIKLTKSKATGISVKNASEIAIKNDVIKNVSSKNQKGNAIHVSNANKVFLDTIFTENNLNGLLIENSTDVIVLHSQFLNPRNSGASVLASTNVTFDTCVFSGSANNGLIFSGQNQDCTVIHCEFPNAEFTNLLVQQINGMVVDTCSFTNTVGDPGKANLVQFGDVNTPEQVANDIRFINSTIINRPAPGGNTFPEGLGLYNDRELS